MSTEESSTEVSVNWENNVQGGKWDVIVKDTSITKDTQA